MLERLEHRRVAWGRRASRSVKIDDRTELNKHSHTRKLNRLARTHMYYNRTEQNNDSRSTITFMFDSEDQMMLLPS
jgi:hypothetical protein